VTQSKWVPVVDVRHLDEILDKAMAETKAADRRVEGLQPSLREKTA
jgi:hypothetical protein